MVGYFTNRANTMSIEDELQTWVELPLPDPEPMRFPGSLLSAEKVSFRYTAKGPLILDGVDIKVHPGGRVALVGESFSKSSFHDELGRKQRCN